MIRNRTINVSDEEAALALDLLDTFLARPKRKGLRGDYVWVPEEERRRLVARDLRDKLRRA
jgi:hypothetical protein